MVAIVPEPSPFPALAAALHTPIDGQESNLRFNVGRRPSEVSKASKDSGENRSVPSSEGCAPYEDRHHSSEGEENSPVARATLNSVHNNLGRPSVGEGRLSKVRSVLISGETLEECVPPALQEGRRRSSNATINKAHEHKRLSRLASFQAARRSTVAVQFNLRADIPAKQGRWLLRRASQEGLDRTNAFKSFRAEAEEKPQSCTVAALRESELWRRMQAMRPLRNLALFSILAVPFFLSMEPACDQNMERQAMVVLKVLHCIGTVCYLAISVGEMLLSRRFYQSAVACDMLVCVGLFAEMAHLREAPSTLPSYWQWPWCLNLAKCWRFWSSWSSHDPTDPFWVHCVNLVIETYIFVHWFACLMAVIALYEHNTGHPTFADAILSEDPRSAVKFYVHSTYFASATVTSIGYGDIYPQNSLEQAVDTVVMILSQMYLAKVFADLNFAKSMSNYWRAQHHQQMALTMTALNNIGAPKSMVQRIIAYKNFTWQVNKEACVDKAFQYMPRLIQEEVRAFLNVTLVMQAPFLQNMSTPALRKIILSLNDETYLPTDFVMRQGDAGSELYFLREGLATVHVGERPPRWEEEEVCKLSSGSCFGEVSLLTGQARSSWVMARSFCVCAVLHKNVVDELIKSDPCVLPTLAKSMKNSLGLRPSTTWKDVADRLQSEFDAEEDVFNFTCSGMDGEAPAGVMTYDRYQSLMQRLNICTVDQKLLWTELDHDCVGVVLFSVFVRVCSAASKEANSPKTKAATIEAIEEEDGRDDKSSRPSSDGDEAHSVEPSVVGSQAPSVATMPVFSVQDDEGQTLKRPHSWSDLTSTFWNGPTPPALQHLGHSMPHSPKSQSAPSQAHEEVEEVPDVEPMARASLCEFQAAELNKQLWKVPEAALKRRRSSNPSLFSLRKGQEGLLSNRFPRSGGPSRRPSIGSADHDHHSHDSEASESLGHRVDQMAIELGRLSRHMAALLAHHGLQVPGRTLSAPAQEPIVMRPSSPSTAGGSEAESQDRSPMQDRAESIF